MLLSANEIVHVDLLRQDINTFKSDTSSTKVSEDALKVVLRDKHDMYQLLQEQCSKTKGENEK